MSATYSVASTKYGDASRLPLHAALDHIESEDNRSGRNYRMDALAALAPGASAAYRDGYDNLTTVTRDPDALVTAASFKRGVLFRHGRILDPSFVPGPGQRFADAPKAVCRVTATRNGNVFYAVGDESRARSVQSAERLLADGAEVLS